MVPIDIRTPHTFARVVRTARHYGFEPFSPNLYASAQGSEQKTQPIRSGSSHIQPLYLPERDHFAAEVHRVIKDHAGPIAACGHPVLFSHATKTAGKEQSMTFGLYLLGSKDGFAEALLLRASLSMLEEAGIRNLMVRINSIGDRDASGKYTRELVNALKRLNTSDDALSIQAKEHAFTVLETLIARRDHMLEHVPRPVDYLTSPARVHFREVIEHLEHNGIRYELDEWLIGHRDFYAHTLFEIVTPNPEGGYIVLARGGRFDECAKRTARAPLPAAAMLFSFSHARELLAQTVKTKTPVIRTPPHFCFIKVGYDAQVKSLSVMETLRRARVSFVQELATPRLSDQLLFAEQSGAPYLIIMGQREAMEDAVIVRHTDTHSQNLVPLCQLHTYVTSLKTPRITLTHRA